MRSTAAPFCLGKHTGVPFKNCSSIGTVNVIRSTKKWIKYRCFDGSIGHGKVKLGHNDGRLRYYVSVGRYNVIWASGEHFYEQ